MIMSDVEIYEEYIGEGENQTKFAIIRVGCHINNPAKLLNESVAKYVGDTPHNQFVDITLCNPWTRVIIRDCRKLTYHTIESLKRDKKIEELIK